MDSPPLQRSHDLLDLFRPPSLTIPLASARPSTHSRSSLPHFPNFSRFARNNNNNNNNNNNSPRPPENWDDDFESDDESSRRPTVRRRRGISVPVGIYRLQGNVIEDLDHMHSFVTIIEELKSLRETRDSLANQLRPNSPAAHAFLQSTRSDWECAEVMIEIASDPESTNANPNANPNVEPESDISLPPPDRQADILRDIISTTNTYTLERRWSSSTGSMCPSLSASTSSSSASSTCELDYEDNELVFSTPSSPVNETCSTWDAAAYNFDEKKIRFGADTLPGLVRYVSELQGRLHRGLVELKSLTV